MNDCFDVAKEIENVSELFKNKYDFHNMNIKINEWFKSIKEEKDRYIYLQLLNRFKYYSRRNIIEALREVDNEVRKFDPGINSTLFFPMLSVTARNNHSFEVHNMYREANQLNKECFKVDINYALKNIPMDKINNIVFIDDMTGSGTTIKESIKEIYIKYEEIFKKDVYILLIEVPEDIEEIEKNIKNEISSNINIIFLNIHKKAFSDGFIFSSEYLEEAKSVVEKYERVLNYKEIDMFGHENGEFLLGFYYDTPNNTISSLWKESPKIEWYPPFSRNTRCGHKPAWMQSEPDTFKGARELKSKKKMRKNANYKTKLR